MCVDAEELQLTSRVSINRWNSLESTRTGSRKLGLHEIQRLPSLASLATFRRKIEVFEPCGQ
jgi:hypothetical protein